MTPGAARISRGSDSIVGRRFFAPFRYGSLAAIISLRLLPCERAFGGSPGLQAAMDMAGVEPRGLRRLHRHGRAQAEGAIEDRRLPEERASCCNSPSACRLSRTFG